MATFKSRRKAQGDALYMTIQDTTDGHVQLIGGELLMPRSREELIKALEIIRDHAVADFHGEIQVYTDAGDFYLDDFIKMVLADA